MCLDHIQLHSSIPWPPGHPSYLLHGFMTYCSFINQLVLLVLSICLSSGTWGISQWSYVQRNDSPSSTLGRPPQSMLEFFTDLILCRSYVGSQLLWGHIVTTIFRGQNFTELIPLLWFMAWGGDPGRSGWEASEGRRQRDMPCTESWV